jgi:tRNA(Ile)-lysidine synthase
MSLSEQLRQYMEQQGWLSAGGRYLLAVSGGMDSTVLTNLLAHLGLDIGIAHCNFKLRGEDADEDERFVQGLAESFGCPFHHTSFDTTAYAKSQGLSIQMAARELRYRWLEETRETVGYTYIATAHHLNDSIETLLYNLVKGCGIRGLHGIPPQQGRIIRPLLFAEQEAIVHFAEAQSISYREDSSNAEVKYRRNFLRHKVLPLLRELNPSLEQTMADNISRFRETEYLYDQMLRDIAQAAILEQSPRFRLRISALLDHQAALPTLLYELLQPFGFNTAQAQEIALQLSAPNTGRQWESATHRLLIDREEIVVEETADQALDETYVIQAGDNTLSLPDGQLSLSYHEGQATFSNDPNQAILADEALRFPLKLRHWQPGDRFQPLGMDGQHQKLKDFFNNNKVSRFDKTRVWVLEDDSGRIAWLVGYRISHAFRLLPDSKACWVLKFGPYS